MDALRGEVVGRKALPESAIQKTPDGLERIARVQIRAVSGYPLGKLLKVMFVAAVGAPHHRQHNVFAHALEHRVC